MNLIDTFDKYFENLKDNKNMMIIIIVFFSIITVYVSYGVSNTIYDLFNNVIFKFVLFCLISFIANKNPALGVILAIFVLTILQIITYNNIISHEGFKYLHNTKSNFEDYLNKPLLTQDKLNPITSNLNLKLENPDQLYKNMIKKGRVLLDDSIDINEDIKKRPDFREKQIYDITKRDGMNLVESGLNRLQVSNDGEYKINNNENNENNKFVKFDKLIQNYINDPQIMSAFNELKYIFNKLQSSTLNEKDVINFDEQLYNVYESELQLLELIYKTKKNNMSTSIQNEINAILKNIKNIKFDKNIIDKYPLLLKNIKILVEYLS